MNDDMKPSDHLYYGLDALPGWNEALGNARVFADSTRWRLGNLISSVLLAAGEEREPVAVAGSLDDDSTGYAFVMYEDLAVLIDVSKLSSDQAAFKVTAHSLDEIADIRVRARHNYFDGIENHARSRGASVELSLAGKDILIPTPLAYGQSPLVKDTAGVAAFAILRDRLAAQRR